MEEIELSESKPFNLEATLLCGQVFRWRKIDDYWYGVVDKEVIKIKQENSLLKFDCSSDDKSHEEIENYFALDHDLPRIIAKINKNQVINKAVKEHYGLRIVRQQPWECLISFILATNANISQITTMNHNLCKTFGEVIDYDGFKFSSFPEPQALRRATTAEILSCGVGHRAESILDTVTKVAEGVLVLENLQRDPYEVLKKELMKVRGVGPKVADCVCLFSYGKLEAFPVDTNIKRIMLERYGHLFKDKVIHKDKALTNTQYETINSRSRRYFGEYAGYAQEYLFYQYRRKKKKSRPSK